MQKLQAKNPKIKKETASTATKPAANVKMKYIGLIDSQVNFDSRVKTNRKIQFKYYDCVSMFQIQILPFNIIGERKEIEKKKKKKKKKNRKWKKRIPASNIKPSKTREECHKYRRFGGVERLGSSSPFGFGGGRQTLHLVNLVEQEREGIGERLVQTQRLLVFIIHRRIAIKGKQKQGRKTTRVEIEYCIFQN